MAVLVMLIGMFTLLDSGVDEHCCFVSASENMLSPHFDIAFEGTHSPLRDLLNQVPMQLILDTNTTNCCCYQILMVLNYSLVLSGSLTAYFTSSRSYKKTGHAMVLNRDAW